MTRRRFRRGNLTSFEIPAPVSLLKTAETPIGMSVKFAQDLENFIPTKRRRLSRRKGLTNVSISGIPSDERIVSGSSLGLPNGTFKLLAVTDAGIIYSSDAALTTWTEERTGLDTDGTYRFAYFDQKLIIVNGLDPNMVWDGTSVDDIAEFVTDDLAGTFAKVDSDTFTFTDGALRGTTDYPAGRNIKLFMVGGSTAVDAIVLSSSGTVGMTITVNLTTSAITGAVIDDVLYEDSPPPFSFIYAAHVRLWALSGGELKARSFRDLEGDKSLTIYYTENTNNVNGWFNATTQEVPFINMENKHIKNDEFVGIALYRKNLVFFGRQNTQVWGGTDPTAVTDPLTWISTFPVGCVNGDLIQEVEQDILFYTNSEIRQFSVVTITSELESSQEKGANIAERVSQQVGKLLDTDANYKTARSFIHSRGGFAGFRLPDEVHIRVEEEDFDGWTRFTQLFQRCRDYTIAPDTRLYMFFEDGTFFYNDEDEVGDDDGEDVTCSWTTPWIQPKEGHLWAGKYYELITEAGDEIPITVTRLKNNSNCFSTTTTVITSPQRSAYWDEAFWDVDAWDCESGTRMPTQEDRFIAETFSYNIKATTSEPTLDIVGFRVYGRNER